MLNPSLVSYCSYESSKEIVYIFNPFKLSGQKKVQANKINQEIEQHYQ